MTDHYHRVGQTALPHLSQVKKKGKKIQLCLPRGHPNKRVVASIEAEEKLLFPKPEDAKEGKINKVKSKSWGRQVRACLSRLP